MPEERQQRAELHKIHCESRVESEVWYKSAFASAVAEVGVTCVTWSAQEASRWQGCVNIRGWGGYECENAAVAYPQELLTNHMLKTRGDGMSTTSLTVALVTQQPLTGYADQVIFWRWDAAAQ